MRTAITMLAAAVAIILLSSCASDAYGRRKTLADHWNAMADWQDTAARSFVERN